MITVSRTRHLYETWKPPSWSPTAAGFIPIAEAVAALLVFSFSSCASNSVESTSLPVEL